MKRFELVLPAYNEAPGLRPLIERAAQAAEAAGFTPETFSLLLVNNGSRDDSEAVLAELSRSALGAWFRVVKVAVNQGYGHGIFTGLQATSAPIVGWSHADSQCDPKDAFKAYEIVAAGGNRLVKGVRSGRNGRDIFVSRVFELFALVILGRRFFEINAQPKVFPAALKAALVDPPKTFAFDLYVLHCALERGYSIETIPVVFPPRIHGASKWASTFLGRYKTILGIIAYMFYLRRNKASGHLCTTPDK